MSLSLETSERVELAAKRFEGLVEHIEGDCDDYPGEALYARETAEKSWRDEESDCDSTRTPCPVIDICFTEDLFPVIRKYGQQTFELPFLMFAPDDVPDRCRDSLWRIFFKGKSDEVINSVKRYDGFKQLGHRFAGIANECYINNPPYPHNGQPFSRVTNPFRAYACITASDYFFEQVYQEDYTGHNQNRYFSNQQRVADDLSIAEKAILVSDILYYVTGAFLFV